MRAVIQRVHRASVTIEGEKVGQIDRGLVVYVGIDQKDGPEDLDYMARKIRYLRVFQDTSGKMNDDIVTAGGAALVISNFTLLGDARKGRRPAFTSAAPPEQARELYEQLCDRLRGFGLTLQTGRFQEKMDVEAVNDGPINLLLDSKRLI